MNTWNTSACAPIVAADTLIEIDWLDLCPAAIFQMGDVNWNHRGFRWRLLDLDVNGWRPWHGLHTPPTSQPVEFATRAGMRGRADGHQVRWFHDQGPADVIAYRIVFNEPARKHSHYFKDVSKLDTIDVYRVLELFNVTDPCLQHAIKKLLVAGGRGHKPRDADIQEAVDTLTRWQEMQREVTA